MRGYFFSLPRGGCQPTQRRAAGKKASDAVGYYAKNKRKRPKSLLFVTQQRQYICVHIN